MIKSDLMNRKMLLVLVLLFLFLLTGCGQRPEPDVEHFQVDVVATLQKPVSQTPPEFLVEAPTPGSEPQPTPSNEPQPTPQASDPIPTGNPVDTPTPTVSFPQATNYPVQTETTYPDFTETTQPTQTAYPTAIFIQTSTPTPVVSAWEGIWNIWYQTSGGYIPATLSVQVNGTNLTATSRINGVNFSFDGEIDTQNNQVEGVWLTGASQGIFWWRMNSAETFIGSRENSFGFCGNRETTTQPNPCLEVPVY